MDRLPCAAFTTRAAGVVAQDLEGHKAKRGYLGTTDLASLDSVAGQGLRSRNYQHKELGVGADSQDKRLGAQGGMPRVILDAAVRVRSNIGEHVSRVRRAGCTHANADGTTVNFASSSPPREHQGGPAVIRLHLVQQHMRL